jgi:hypothetical protein
VRGQDPVGTKETVDDDALTSGVALCVGDGDGRHPQVALTLLDPRFPLRIAEPQPPGIAQTEPGEHLVCLVLGGIHQVEPEHLILVQAAKRLGPVIDACALLPVEEKGRHHATVTRSRP